MGILAFIVVLGLIAIVHEYGHFVTARKSGIGVDEFGLGFPPRLWAKKIRGTEYSINLLPIGGFVRLHGEQSTDGKPDEKSFAQARVGRKLLVLVAGVVMNVILAWVLMAIVMGIGTRVASSDIPADRHVQASNPQVLIYTNSGTAAAKAGITNGDRLMSINGQLFTSTENLITYLQKNKYPTLDVVVEHQGQIINYKISPDTANNTTRYGIGIEETTVVKYAWYIAPWYSLKYLGYATSQTFIGLGQLVAGLFHGQVSDNVTGPVGIAVLTSEVRKFGLVSLMQFTAMLSLGFAVLNIVPFPALDGGRAAIVIGEAIAKRKMKYEMENAIHTVGFLLLIGLAIFLSVRDVARYNLVNQLIHWFR